MFSGSPLVHPSVRPSYESCYFFTLSSTIGQQQCTQKKKIRKSSRSHNSLMGDGKKRTSSYILTCFESHKLPRSLTTYIKMHYSSVRPPTSVGVSLSVGTATTIESRARCPLRANLFSLKIANYSNGKCFSRSLVRFMRQAQRVSLIL